MSTLRYDNKPSEADRSFKTVNGPSSLPNGFNTKKNAGTTKSKHLTPYAIISSGNAIGSDRGVFLANANLDITFRIRSVFDTYCDCYRPLA